MLLTAVRTALFVPGSKPRALAKAAGLGAGMVIVDLEDAVPDAAKADAREAAVAALAAGFGDAVRALRLNGAGTRWHADDLAAARDSAAEMLVLPKVESPGALTTVADVCGKPVLAMVETPAAIFDARAIAGAAAGLIAGTNDLAAALGLPRGAGRGPLALSLQTIVLAARERGIAAFDGVSNALDDPQAVAREAAEARALGFTGKTLIHPSQIGPTRAAFAPTAEELGEARRLVAAATGGAERFEGRQIEAMHVAYARALLAEAGAMPTA